MTNQEAREWVYVLEAGIHGIDEKKFRDVIRQATAKQIIYFLIQLKDESSNEVYAEVLTYIFDNLD